MRHLSVPCVSMSDYEEIGADDGFTVTAPSGGIFTVLTQDEVDYFTDRASRYQKDNHFVNVSDLQDVDRMLIMELMCWRYGLWLSQERDYWGQGVDIDALKKSLFEYSKELRLLKKSLGIDKAQREKDKGESVADYLETLRVRAKEFGVMREQQLTKALTLFKELQALLTFHDNCDEIERREQNIEVEDILEWLRTVAFPEFDQIDHHFRHKQQRYWVREL